jgi:hypothetical protein
MITISTKLTNKQALNRFVRAKPLPKLMELATEVLSANDSYGVILSYIMNVPDSARCICRNRCKAETQARSNAQSLNAES